MTSSMGPHQNDPSLQNGGSTSDATNTHCAICKSLYKHPKVLPCLHAFCFGCIRSNLTQDTNTMKNHFVCPICHDQHWDLKPEHLFADYTRDAAAAAGDQTKFCSPCKIKREWCVAFSKCESCACFLCMRCIHPHKIQHDNNQERKLLLLFLSHKF